MTDESDLDDGREDPEDPGPIPDDVPASDADVKSPPAKKAAAKKAAAKKSAAKKVAKKNATTKAAAKSQAHQAKFPRHSVEKALRIPKAIFDQNAGKGTTVADAANFTTGGKATGEFNVEVSSAKKYGFLRSEGGKLVPTDRALKALAPQSDTDRLEALREAVLEAPDLADVYSHYRGERSGTQLFGPPATTPARARLCSNISFVSTLADMSAVTEKDRDQAREVLHALGSHPRITTDDGTVLDLPQPVLEALAEFLEAAADGERALVLRSPEDLTTEQAAAVLGVSRPTVVRLVEAGKLPARMVGTHRRLALGDVLAYREASAAKRRSALDEMTREAEVLGLYD